MKVIKANVDNLASVIVTSPKLEIFQDIWRHKKGLRVEVILDTFVDFILSDKEIIQFLNFKQVEKLEAYKYKSSPQALYDLYPYFVKDIMLAQVSEIFRADKKNLTATEIMYLPPTSNVRNIPHNLLPKKCFELGRNEIAKDLSGLKIYFEIDVSERNVERLNYCYACYGYSCMAIKYRFPFTWVLIP